MVNLPETLLEGLEVQLPMIAGVELGPEPLDPSIALVLGNVEVILHLGDQLGRAHSDCMSRRGLNTTRWMVRAAAAAAGRQRRGRREMLRASFFSLLVIGTLWDAAVCRARVDLRGCASSKEDRLVAN